jgi:glycosyltransferase involved in cell wall biosynthesis
MQKVLFVAPSAYPLGGVAVWLDYLTADLPSHGWIPIAGLVAGRLHDVARYRNHYPNLPTISIENPTGSAEGRIRALLRAMEAVEPDVVVGVNIVDLYAAVRRTRAKGVRLRAVMSLHGIVGDLLGDLKREGLGLDAVIATNRMTCRLCETWAAMPPERVFYAPYGVEVPNGDTPPRPAAAGPLRIAWVGRLEQPQKRVGLIRPILQFLDARGFDYRMMIAGDGPERDRLLKDLKPWLRTGRVEYLGPVPAEDVGSVVYAHADAFLLTSSWETGPIVVWEAMAAGLAVVSSRYVGSGLEGALRHGENCLLFPIHDAAEASTQLARLGDTRLRQALIRGGRELVIQRYSVPRSVSVWADALNQIMGRPVRSVSDFAPTPSPAGRLDRLFGIRHGESIRRLLGLRFAHSCPGGEWPHSASATSDEDEFLAFASRVDQAGSTG